MRFSIEQVFDLPLDAVEEALLDPRYVDRLADLPKLGRPQLLTHEVRGSTVVQEIRYAFAADVSAAVRRVVDPRKLTWIEASTTDLTTHRTEFRILPDHYAHLLHCHGTFTLEARDGTTVRTMAGDVKISVPLVGSKVERVIVSGMEDHAREEVPLVEEWVASR